MHPFESRLTNDAGAEQHLRDTIMPNLDEFVSKPAFEEVCQEHIRVVEGAATVGVWWGQVRERTKWVSRELDGVALDGDGSAIAIASCKWTNTKAGVIEEALLSRLEAELPRTSPDMRHYFCSKSGFDEALTALAAADADRITLVAPADMYA